MLSADICGSTTHEDLIGCVHKIYERLRVRGAKQPDLLFVDKDCCNNRPGCNTAETTLARSLRILKARDWNPLHHDVFVSDASFIGCAGLPALFQAAHRGARRK